MTETKNTDSALEDPDMQHILEDLLAHDENITARAVARRHPRLHAASSITRSPARNQLLAQYQQRQAEFRRWQRRLPHQASALTAATLAERDVRIATLERQVALLTASHLAMLRVVGELGGFGKWAAFYEHYADARAQLDALGAVPVATITPLSTTPPKGKPPKA
jgi:hypothetical protein